MPDQSPKLIIICFNFKYHFFYLKIVYLNIRGFSNFIKKFKLLNLRLFYLCKRYKINIV